MAREPRFAPDTMPVLSRGKHRNPRKGACFMEMASYLAGERWSDHPACTNPLLAALARGVNDYTSDEARSRLSVLVPSVVGVVSDDPGLEPRIALICAKRALPIVAAERQRVMAVGVLVAERLLNDLDGRPADHLDDASRSALEDVPQAAQWARRFTGDQRPSNKDFQRRGGPAIVASAVRGIAEAAPNADEVLHDLLVDAIAECRRHVRPDARAAEPNGRQPLGAC